jgi:Family of unknown function (DUF6627)
MNTKKLSHRSWIVVMSAALLCFQASTVQAAIVSTGQIAAQTQTYAERAKVQAFLDRADVKKRIQMMGVGGLMAKDRVAALSDQEVHLLAQKIDSLPAGGNLGNGNLSDSDLIVILLIAILVVIAI